MKYYCLLLMIIPVISHAQWEKKLTMIDTVIKSYFRDDEPGGAILIVREGRVIYRNAIGVADIQTKEPITSNTLFNIGSISKPIVAMGILRLASEGRLSLDDELSRYFPDFKNKEIARKVKLFHLLTHTSGLPDLRRVKEEHEFYLTAKDEENFAPLKLADTLEFEPGTRYRYSNPAFNGLALIIEKVTGEKWQSYIRENIFLRAGMETSTITDGPHPESGVAHAYIRKDDDFVELDYGEEPTFAAAGNGGVWSSVEELWALEQAIQANRILEEKWTTLSRTRYTLPGWLDTMPSRLGLSWFLTKHMEFEMIGHTGSQGGFISDYVWLPERKLFYVLLCNTPKPIAEIRERVLKLIN